MKLSKNVFFIACVAVILLTIALYCLNITRRLFTEDDSLNNIEVIVTPQLFTIRQLDPLFLKVTVRNRTNKPLILNRPLRNKHETIIIEALRPGTTEYQMVGTRGYGLICAEYIGHTIIPPSEKYVSYELLFCWKGFVFSENGTYELRAKLTTEGEHVSSSPVRIQVTPISQPEREAIKKMVKRDYGARLIRPGVNVCVLDSIIDVDNLPTHYDVSDIAFFERTLTDSNLKRTIQWIQVLMAATQKGKQPNQSSEEAIAMLREKLDPVTNEIIDLLLAREYARMENWTEAENLLFKIKEPSEQRDRLRQLIEDEKGLEKSGKSGKGE